MISKRAVNRFVPPVPTKPTLFFDLETLPTEDPEVIAMLAEKIKTPANYSNPGTIAKWEAEEKPKLVADAINKTSFDGTYGRICCVGWAYNERPVQSAIGDESEVLQAFFDAIIAAAPIYVVGGSLNITLSVVGHNMKSFDLRFLWQRATILKISKPPHLPWSATYWDDRVQDTMLMWNPDTSKRISLGRLCKTLGVKTPKTDFDGSMVAEAWARGERGKIAAYCEGDVEATRECWWRMREQGV